MERQAGGVEGQADVSLFGEVAGIAPQAVAQVDQGVEVLAEGFVEGEGFGDAGGEGEVPAALE